MEFYSTLQLTIPGYRYI